MIAAFPLILTFSLGEKEQQLDISTFAKTIRAADRSQFAKTLRAFPPLRVGGVCGADYKADVRQRAGVRRAFFPSIDFASRTLDFGQNILCSITF
jgi:hypothetical protein